jgi:hypothetical protein
MTTLWYFVFAPVSTAVVNVSAVPSLDVFAGDCPHLRWNQAINCTAADLNIANNLGIRAQMSGVFPEPCEIRG